MKRLWDEDSRAGRDLKVVLLGAAPLAGEPERWRRYILDALLETTIARDVLLLTRVDKPARTLLVVATASPWQSSF